MTIDATLTLGIVITAGMFARYLIRFRAERRRLLHIVRFYRLRRDHWLTSFLAMSEEHMSLVEQNEALKEEHQSLVETACEMQVELDAYHSEDIMRSRVVNARMN